MNGQTRPKRVSKRAHEALRSVRLRAVRLTRTEVDQIADAIEAESGKVAGPRAVYRGLNSRGSLTTISTMLKAREREREAVQALVDDGQSDGASGAGVPGSDPGGHGRADVGRRRPGAGPVTALQKLTFEVQVLRKVVREQGRTLAALLDRTELVELRQTLPDEREAPTAEAQEDRLEPMSQDGIDQGAASKPKASRYRSQNLTREESHRLHAAIVAVVKAGGGSTRKHDLYERLPAPWRDILDTHQVYEFAKVRGRSGSTLVYAGGVFTPGPDADLLLDAVRNNTVANNPRVLAKERKSASRMFTKKAIAHLKTYPTRKISVRDLFEIVKKQIQAEDVNHRIIDANTLYRSLYNIFFREGVKVESGNLPPGGRTLIHHGDRMFSKE